MHSTSDRYMSGLLPTRTEKTVRRSGEPSMLFVDDKETEEILSALASETTRNVFCALNEDALTASEVASDQQLSLQNASYHLDKLRDVGLITVIDTCYSEKGRKMDVYAVSSDWTVLVLGTRDDGPGLRRAFQQMAGAIGAPAILIAVWSSLADLIEPLTEG